MPAKSEKEAHLMQMALAVKTGKKKLSDMPEGVRDKIKKINKDMTEKQLREFSKVKEGKGESQYGVNATFKHDWELDNGTKVKAGDEVTVDLIREDPNTHWTLISVSKDGKFIGYAEAEAVHTMLDINEAKKTKSEKFKYLVTYTDGTAVEEELSLRQRSDMKKRDDWKKVKSVRSLGRVKEDGEAGPAGGATLGNTVGLPATDFGNNPQNGNSDQRKGSGTYNTGGNQKRELTDDEKKMLGIAEKDEEGTKVMSYDNFKAKSVKENYAPEDKVQVAVKMIFGDFSEEAIKALKKVPVVNGLVEIKSINEALSGTYKEGQIRKVIDAISAQ